MIKRFFIIPLAIFIVAFFSLTSFAVCSESGTVENNEYDIDSLEVLDEEVEMISRDDDLSANERKEAYEEIVNCAEPEVVEEYIESCYDDLENTIDGVEFVLPSDRSYIEYNYETENGGVVSIKLSDQQDKTIASIFGLNSYADAAIDETENEEKFKKIGKRYFTGHCYYQCGFVAIRLKVKNHYIVNDERSVKKNWAEVVECSGMFLYCDNEVTDIDWEKKLADKPGEAIRCRIQVTSHVGAIPRLGIVPCTKYYYAVSKVKLVKRTTKDGAKGVIVKESMKWDL